MGTDKETGIDKESDRAAELQIGPTTRGMVRVYIASDGVELPLDFDPEEAEEMAEELRAAAARAREMRPQDGGTGQPGGGTGRPGGGDGRPGARRRQGRGGSGERPGPGSER